MFSDQDVGRWFTALWLRLYGIIMRSRDCRIHTEGASWFGMNCVQNHFRDAGRGCRGSAFQAMLGSPVFWNYLL